VFHNNNNNNNNNYYHYKSTDLSDTLQKHAAVELYRITIVS